MKKIIILLFILFNSFSYSQKLENGFVYLSDIDQTIQLELRYLSHHNFIGKPINGYYKSKIIVTKETAEALKNIQQILLKKGLSLKIFDAYRPQQAVDHFVLWAKDLKDTLMKNEFYPDVPKNKLFEQGYIATKSGHTRGSTVDLTIINVKSGKELNMGSPYDFFGEKSHTYYDKIDKKEKQNRLFLRKIMIENGFKPYNYEWWHFTLKEEPFPKKYFNFPVE
ncbi:M15 family metallopeptidase [Polaribacter sp. Asnod1-A03]|uniref:M15 family metallopeptidase n=1 Tax=Polaribacter sp. Asnod1-A03 TaxID=3160581 RepID=UPI003863C1AA